MTKVSKQVLAIEDTKYIGAVGQPAFVNTWHNYNNGFHTAGFYKDAEGIVHLTGLVQHNTSGTATNIFQLPAGYRPNASIIFAVNASAVFGGIYVYADGYVYLAQGAGNGFVNLDGISFKAEA